MSAVPDRPVSGKPDFLVFSDDWGEHPSSCQHIFRHIAKEHRVLWVNTIGMRNPTFTMADARKITRKVSKMLGAHRVPAATVNPEQRITVCQPLMLPGIRSPLVRAINARSVTRKVAALLRTLQFDDAVVVTTAPNAAEYPDLLRGRQVIYYCVDDFSLWPGLDAGLVRDMEARLIERADVLIAVSETLFQRLSQSGKPTHLLTHGVDVEMFCAAAVAEHTALRIISRPRAGFFGLIDGRMDRELLENLIRQMPHISFVLAGPVDASFGELPRAGNLHFIGPVPYAQLPTVIAGFDVLILPYRSGSLAETLSPLKFKEYLATGKPVVSAAIAEARRWAGMIDVAGTAEEWSRAIATALSTDARGRDAVCRDLLAEESWSQKAGEFLHACRPGEAEVPLSRMIREGAR